MPQPEPKNTPGQEQEQLPEPKPLFGPSPADGPQASPAVAQGGGVGSVLDPEGGVFTPNDFSSWEQFAEQAFTNLNDLTYSAGAGPSASLFGGNAPAPSALSPAILGGGHGRHLPMAHSLTGPTPLSSLGLPLPPVNPHGFAPLADDDDIADPIETEPTPDDFDPLFSSQWYIRNTSGGVDLNVITAWDDYTGSGVRVAICDAGVEYSHPDLASNSLVGQGYNEALGINDGSPPDADAKHATMVAGFVAAAKNGIGIQGIAYDAKIASFIGSTEAQVGAVLERQTGFDISQNSWTFGPLDNSPNSLAAFEVLARDGRGGLGTVSIMAGSNERDRGILSTYYDTNDSPYTIAVGAVTISGQYTDFSCAGPNLLVTAPGKDVISTDRQPPGGYDSTSSYYADDGTSFSSPMISGVVALMLEANPDLGYRDVMSILAYSAVKTANTPSQPPWDWQYNGMENWNGGGMHASHDYGFGLTDATAAVRMAESWDQGSNTYGNQDTFTDTATPDIVIPDNDTTGIASIISVGDDLDVQQAVVSVNIEDGRFEQYDIRLHSPSGTYSVLYYLPSIQGFAAELKVTQAEVITACTDTFGDTDIWTMKTVMPFGESSVGDWTLTVKDLVSGITGTLKSWTLTLYGDDASADDLYIYTDEFYESAANDATRSILVDTSGTDTINASAVTSSSIINLAPGSTSTIDDAMLAIDAGTTIENVHTGDGNDTISGNGVDNDLFGWRGNDVISGLGGDDVLFGGEGMDILRGGSGSDIFQYVTTQEAGDTIADFNHADDAFNFSYDGFGQSGTGTLGGDHFFTSAGSVNVNDACFIFEDTTLYYDPDGTGTQASTEIADVTGDAVQVDDIIFV